MELGQSRTETLVGITFRVLIYDPRECVVSTKVYEKILCG